MHCVWKSQKKSHSTLRAKRATFTFWVDKSSLKMSKWSFWKSEAYNQPVLPDRLILIRQKLVGNAKIVKFKCNILSILQTLWPRLNFHFWALMAFLEHFYTFSYLTLAFDRCIESLTKKADFCDPRQLSHCEYSRGKNWNIA